MNKLKRATGKEIKKQVDDKKSGVNVLMVYPDYPETFWSFKHAIKFISKKAVNPPLGLLTVAAMLPENWNKQIVDMNTSALRDRDIEWADYVFISAMAVQKKAVEKVINRCKKAGVKIVAGGPLFTAFHEDFADIDHFVLGEAEMTLPLFLEDLEKGNLKPVYASQEFPDLSTTPAPLWELINMKKYVSIDIQYSRGCPFNCDFCDITTLFGRKVRTKSKQQILTELDSIYSRGWRGNIFFVDDNFIGNKVKTKNEILPALTEWMDKKKHPFTFLTETSINLADDEELMIQMVRAGFDSVFIGIETPDDESLTECSKFQNKNRDLLECIKKIQKQGLEVSGGFIVGFDNDPPSIFKKQIEFIQDSGIITAMVGLLNAPRNTKLYRRLMKENRLLKDLSGDNTDFSINFIPKMGYEKLIQGYKKIIEGIYSAKPYYERVMNFLKEKKIIEGKTSRLRLNDIKALVRSIFILGIKDKNRLYYWKLFFWSLFKRPRLFPSAITFAIYGFHFRKVFNT